MKLTFKSLHVNVLLQCKCKISIIPTLNGSHGLCLFLCFMIYQRIEYNCSGSFNSYPAKLSVRIEHTLDLVVHLYMYISMTSKLYVHKNYIDTSLSYLWYVSFSPVWLLWISKLHISLFEKLWFIKMESNQFWRWKCCWFLEF